jgi:hypothetical protein
LVPRSDRNTCSEAIETLADDMPRALSHDRLQRRLIRSLDDPMLVKDAAEKMK